MSEDDRQQPKRVANTAMMNQTGKPPPASVLAAVMAAGGGAAPEFVAALPDWGHGETTWRVLGCAGRVLFEVRAYKGVNEWHGGEGDNEDLALLIWPLAEVIALQFDLDSIGHDGYGGTFLRGTWTVTRRSGEELRIPSEGRNESQGAALAGIVETIRASL